METNENTQMSARDRHIGRLREKYPDKTFEDDEEIYGQIGEDYDNYENEIGGYKEREKSLSDMFSADPRSAVFMNNIRNGKNPVIDLLKGFGPDIKETLDDPEKMQEVADAWAQDQERIAQSQKLDEEYAENMSQSLDALRQYQQERGLSDEQTDDIIFKLIGVVRDGVMGKFTPEMFDMMSKANTYDTDVAAAQEEGTIAGRNQKITEQLRKSNKSDGVTALGGANGSPGGGNRTKNIFELAGEAS